MAQLALLFKIFVFCFPHPHRFCSTHFWGISDSFPYPHTTPSCPNKKNQPSLHIINRFKQISKVWFYQSNCDYQKWIFDFLNPFTTILGHLNWQDIFRFIFRELRMTFFYKIMMTKKNSCSSNSQYNLAKSKVILNVKLMNLKETK